MSARCKAHRALATGLARLGFRWAGYDGKPKASAAELGVTRAR